MCITPRGFKKSRNQSGGKSAVNELVLPCSTLFLAVNLFRQHCYVHETNCLHHDHNHWQNGDSTLVDATSLHEVGVRFFSLFFNRDTHSHPTKKNIISTNYLVIYYIQLERKIIIKELLSSIQQDLQSSYATELLNRATQSKIESNWNNQADIAV